jgi:transketolase
MLYPLPNMKILCPGDPVEVEAVMHWINSTTGTGPVYLRLGKLDPVVHSSPITFELGKGIIINNDHDNLAIFSVGNTLSTAVAIRELLRFDNRDARLVSMVTMKPLSESFIKDISKDLSEIITIEEHSKYGGLGSIVTNYLYGSAIKLFRFSLPDIVLDKVGDHAYLRNIYGLSADNIYKTYKQRRYQ